MSQPNRFHFDSENGQLVEAGLGEWVRHSDYAALAADKEAETKATFDAIRLITQLRDDYAALAAENERLKAETVKQIEAALPPVEAYIAKLEAENERLRAAGDVMAAIICPPAHGPGEWDGEYEAWHAAKGVQS